MNWFYIKTGPIQGCLLALLLMAGAQIFAGTPPPLEHLAPNFMAPPNWSVNPDNFEFNMNAVIRVQYNSVPNNAASNLVGAFVGNELRGVASPIVIAGNAYYFLTIYSNIYTGEQMHFKAYIAANDNIYPAMEQVTFIHNLKIGNDNAPYWINIDPNADFPPELTPILADTTLVSIPFDPIDLQDYTVSLDGDPVTWNALPGPNLMASIVNGILSVAPISGSWTGTDSVRIIVTETTPNQLKDTIYGHFTVIPDYGAPVWQTIPNQSIFSGQAFTPFDLDNYLLFNGPCRQFDSRVFPFLGTAPDPAWPVVAPGNQPMNIVARPLFANIQLAGPGAKLAGFVNGTLAGWAGPTGTAPNVVYNIALKNVGAGNITFRFYDASRQYLYAEISNLGFAAGGSAGTVSAPFALQLSPLVPSLAANGAVTIAIDDPSWLGVYPLDFLVWDCDYPDLRRDTMQALYTITTDIRPSITSPATVNFEENACSVLYDTQSSDPTNSEGAGLTYSLAGGGDASRFSINAQNGILSWAAGFSPDFENPMDADNNNSYLVNIRVTNAANLSDTLALTVTITNQLPEPFVASINNGASAICASSSVNLQANGGFSYVWSTGSTQASITVTTAGTYTVTATSSGACKATAAVTVAPPPSITAAGNANVCVGATIQLGSTPVGGTLPYASFSWTGPNSFTANVEDPAGFTAVAASSGTYQVTVTDNLGCTASASTPITVSGNSAPSIAAMGNTPVCEGATIQLTSVPSGGSGSGYTYVWGGPNSYGAVAQNPLPFMATPAAAGMYRVTLTDGAGCTGVGMTTIAVNAKPNITTGSNSPVSVGGQILLNSTTSGGSGSGYAYAWSGPNNFTSTVAQPAGFPAILASAGIYRVTVTDGNGCTGTNSTTVSVAECPNITAATNSPICEGGIISLTSTPLGGALPYTAFAWSGPNGFTAIVEDPASFLATMAANGTYTVVVTDLLGCTASASIGVVVRARPTITAANSGPVCAGAVLTVSSTPAGGSGTYSAFQWIGPDFFSSFVEDPTSFITSVASSGVYQVKVTDNQGCTATGTTTAVVNPKPGITASSNSPLCTGALLNLQSNPSGGSGVYASFLWSGPNAYSSNLEDPSPFAINVSNAGIYSVTVTDNAGCSATASTTLSISSLIAPTITAGSNSPLCSGNALVLVSTPGGGSGVYQAFSWSGPNSYSAAQQNPTPFTSSVNSAGLYTVTVTDSKNCKGTASVTVVVTAPPVNASSNSPVCPGGSILLSAGAPLSGSVTYAWSGPNNFTSMLREPTTFLAGPGTSGTYSVTVTQNGCINSGSVNVVVSDITPPVITCPAAQTINANSSCSAAIGSYSATSVSDNCNPNPTVSQSPAASTVLSGHNTAQTITLTANDGNGNTAGCTFTVTLKDVTPPSITCPANTTIAANAGCSGLAGAYAAVTVGDNCNANPTVSQSPAAATVLNGHNDEKTVTLTANDGNGNTATCTFTVKLKDVTPPVITCPANTTVAANASCSGIVGTYSAAAVSDNCNANPAVTQSPAAATVLSGHNDAKTATLTAADGNGNTATCTFTVTLKDVSPPNITCPPNTTAAANATCSGTVGAYSAVALSDNCNANPTVTQSPVATTTLSGHNDVKTVTLTANDGNGNSSICLFTVTLKDVTPPVVTCPANTTVAANATCIGTVGAYSAVTVSDNCAANPTVTQSPAASTILSGHNDVKTVTLTANDGNGNTGICTFTVTLKDITSPTITCPPNATVAANASCSGVVGAYSAVAVGDNCNANPTVTQSPAAATTLSGHNDVKTITLTAYDGNGNTATCTFTVTLKDVTPPTVVCKNATASLSAAGAAIISPANVFQSGADNCETVNQVSVLPNTFTCSNLGPNTVVLTVNDGNGNTATCTALVTVVDLIPPTMVCQNVVVALSALGQASVTAAQVNNGSSDNCTLVTLSLSPTNFTCANLGENTVTLTGTDQSNNSATCTAKVNVLDLIPPTTLCKNATINLNLNGQVTLTAAQINNGSFDNCSIVSLTVSKGLFTCADLGANLVQLTATDQSGNTGQCTATVTVVDLIAPMAKCKNFIANLGPTGTVSVAASSINNGSSDNCTFTLSLTPSTFTCANLGLNIVTLKATDGSGNMNTCTAVVTVKDVTPPTVLCKNATIFLNSEGKATLLPAQVDNGSSDNCGIISRSINLTQFNCSDINAPKNVFLTATDGSGNTSLACLALVTIKDVTPPTAICRDTTVHLASNGQVSVPGSTLANGSYDNCSVWSFTPIAKVYTAANLGPNNLVITVKDFSGNGATCTSVVTVLNNFTNPSGDNVAGNAATSLVVNGSQVGAAQTLTQARGEMSDFLLTLYPNPTAGDVQLNFMLPEEQYYQLRVLDLTGKLLLDQADSGMQGPNSVSIRLDHFSPGVYLVEFRTASGREVHRLIVNKG